MAFANNTSGSRHLFNQRRISAAIALAVLLAANAHGAPTGGNVVGGEGIISQTGSETIVTQATERLSVDWDSFNIESGERVQFVQPGTDSIALNRILGNDASHIFGQLDANGHVILVNPNGIIFGEGAVVNVGGLVASGLDIDPSDFLNGDLVFKDSGFGDGVVINRGLISAATGGNVALLGKQVANEGLIQATLGTVSLAAGRQAVLSFDPQGLLGVRVSEQTLQEALGHDAAVSNSGTIEAAGGRVLLTASVSQDVFSQAVNSGDMTGDAQVMLHDDGSFTLGQGASLVNSGEILVGSADGGDSSPDVAASGHGVAVLLASDVQLSGRIDASSATGDAGQVVLAAAKRAWIRGGEIRAEASAEGSNAGTVTLLGRHVGMTDGASVSTNGAFAGTVTIGGKNSAPDSQLLDTELVYISEGTAISAASDLNSGGDISVWSDAVALVAAAMDVSSTDAAGSASIQSQQALGYTGTVNLQGQSALKSGSLVLSSNALSIADERNLFSISQAALKQALSSGSVLLEAGQSVSVAEGAAFTVSLDHDLTITARGNSAGESGTVDLTGLTLDSRAAATETDFVIEADIIAAAPQINIGHPAAGESYQPINVTFTAHQSDILHNSNVSTYGGNYNAQAAGDVIFSGAALHTAAANEAGVGIPNTSVSIDSGGQVALSLGSYAPQLTVSGQAISIDAEEGFYAEQITAESLRVSTTGIVEARADVSGTAQFFSPTGAEWRLSGDFSIVEAELGSASDFHLTEDTDLVLGNMLLAESGTHIVSIGMNSTISQGVATKLQVNDGGLEIKADNIEIGAHGTSEIATSNGFLDFAFDQRLILNGAVRQGASFGGLNLVGSSNNNEVTIGEHAVYTPSEFGLSVIDLGGGNDIVSLKAPLPIEISLGAGVDIINLLHPDLHYSVSDFNAREDIISQSSL